MDLIVQLLAALGGAGILIILLSFLFRILGRIWPDLLKESERRRTEYGLELRRQLLGHRRIQADRFAESQYDIYLELWEALQALWLTVDALWHKATKQNISSLARELHATKAKIQKRSIFFEDSHLIELNRLIETLEQFKAGKIRLVDIRSQQDMREVSPYDIQREIESNRQYKEKFEELLDKLGRSFRDRLSDIEYQDIA